MISQHTDQAAIDRAIDFAYGHSRENAERERNTVVRAFLRRFSKKSTPEPAQPEKHDCRGCS